MKQINFQPISKSERNGNDGNSLLVHSIFLTIQGEGPHVGKPAVFIRLGGCNLQCPGCDTEYTNGAQVMSIDEIEDRVRAVYLVPACDATPMIVITGGEPMRQNLIPLVNRLCPNYKVQIETNGTLGFYGTVSLSQAVWKGLDIVVSPKSGKVAENIQPFIVAYKYVLDRDHIDPTDGLPTSVLGMPGAPARPFDDFEGEVYVQPADQEPHASGWAHRGENRKNLDATIDSAIKYGYRLCVQVHKVAGLA
jgi:organic radical activating enzyme